MNSSEHHEYWKNSSQCLVYSEKYHARATETESDNGSSVSSAESLPFLKAATFYDYFSALEARGANVECRLPSVRPLPPFSAHKVSKRVLYIL